MDEPGTFRTHDASPREVYAFVEARLDMDYVRQTARHIAAALRGQGEPLGVVLQPGDGTRYDLAFLPLQNLRGAPGRVKDGQVWDSVPDFGSERAPGTALVTWYQQHAAGGFDFRSGGFEPIYLSERFDTTLGSASTIAILFNAVAETWNA